MSGFGRNLAIGVESTKDRNLFGSRRIRKTTHLHQPFWLSKTRVFEKGGACGKLGQENGLTVSKNSFLVLPSQKGYGQMCFERSVRDIWLRLRKESTVSFRRTKH